MLREIDTRPIPGNGGEVELTEQLGRFFVTVWGIEGELVARIETGDRAEALSAYRHPFARSDVPDIFAREPELIGVEE